ncbi:hypothetical protein NDU88_007281 [Pleurodeles waltl]|uniref:Uncharacterized protein n=1 Tax=Pleurodeles waltl TaxID=8319 RepID=A0AAV7QPD4_PLEWA|nr:hypothetical protein NDU88_007281 [Pleurodeles waltl]
MSTILDVGHRLGMQRKEEPVFSAQPNNFHQSVMFKVTSALPGEGVVFAPFTGIIRLLDFAPLLVVGGTACELTCVFFRVRFRATLGR